MKKILSIEKIILFQNENTRHKTFHICLFPFHKWMEMFGKFDINNIERIIEYSKKEMTNQENIQKVKDYVNKMQNQISSC
ncbi:MAG: hypothetical protein Q8N88_03775 [Nanoarchaeota archaeon]|nr:hypothetical protein [Nanoarchaeota archaeon]